jgi:hypothetical protein
VLTGVAGSKAYSDASPMPLFALTLADPISVPAAAAALGPSATLLLHPSQLLQQAPAPPLLSPIPADVTLDTLRRFFPPRTPSGTTAEMHEYVIQPGRRYAFCVTLQHRGGRLSAAAAGEAAGAGAAGPNALQITRGQGAGLEARVVGTRLRGSAELRKAVVRVEAIYEVDGEGKSF